MLALLRFRSVAKIVPSEHWVASKDRGFEEWQIATNSRPATKRLHVRTGFVDYPIAAEADRRLWFTWINELECRGREGRTPVKTAKCRMRFSRQVAVTREGVFDSSQSSNWQRLTANPTARPGWLKLSVSFSDNT
jgi:hypothetical protein